MTCQFHFWRYLSVAPKEDLFSARLVTFYDFYLILKLWPPIVVDMLITNSFISDQKCFTSTHSEEFVSENILHGE